MRQHYNSYRHGVSLVELAIVVGVIGIIMGGIWSYASSAWEDTHVEQMMEQITGVVNSTRDLYIGQQGVPRSGGAVLTGSLIEKAVIPSNTLRRGLPCTQATPTLGAMCSDTPWGPTDPAFTTTGTFAVCDWTLGQANCVNAAAAGFAQLFAVEIRGLNQSRCLKVAQKVSLAISPPGYMAMNINGVTVMGPYPPATANANCVNANTNVIRIVYKLHV